MLSLSGQHAIGELPRPPAARGAAAPRATEAIAAALLVLSTSHLTAVLDDHAASSTRSTRPTDVNGFYLKDAVGGKGVEHVCCEVLDDKFDVEKSGRRREGEA